MRAEAGNRTSAQSAKRKKKRIFAVETRERESNPKHHPKKKKK
jgi:hypothetical protein